MSRKLDNHHLLMVYCKVVDSGTLSRAASELNIPNSSVSKAISELERRYEQTFLYRTTRTFTLTEAGRLFYKKGKEILKSWQELEAEIKNLNDEPNGELKIAVSTWLHLFSKICSEFGRTYPQLNLELLFSASDYDLYEDNIDVAIQIWDGLPDSPLYSQPLLAIKMIVVASPEYIARTGSPQKVEELSHHNFLMSSFLKLENVIHFKDQSVPINGNLVSSSRFSILDSVLAGNGLAYLPAYFCQEELANGRLIEILPEIERPHQTLGALYKDKRHSSKKVDAFLTFTENALSDFEGYLGDRTKSHGGCDNMSHAN